MSKEPKRNKRIEKRGALKDGAGVFCINPSIRLPSYSAFAQDWAMQVRLGLQQIPEILLEGCCFYQERPKKR